MNFQDLSSGISQAHLANQRSGERGTAAGVAESRAMQQAFALQEQQRADAYRQEMNAANQGAQLPGSGPAIRGQYYESTPYIAPPAAPVAPVVGGLAMQGAAPGRAAIPPPAAAAGAAPTAYPGMTKLDALRAAQAEVQTRRDAYGNALPWYQPTMLAEGGPALERELGRAREATNIYNAAQQAASAALPAYRQSMAVLNSPNTSPEIRAKLGPQVQAMLKQHGNVWFGADQANASFFGGAPAAQGKVPAGAQAPVGRGQGTTVPGPTLVPNAPPGQPAAPGTITASPLSVPSAAQAQAAAPAGPINAQSFAAGAGSLADKQNLRMIDMQLQQAQAMMDAANATGNPEQFQQAQAAGMGLIKQRNVLVGTQAINDFALGGTAANDALHTINQTFGTQFSVKSRVAANGKRDIDVYHGGQPVPGMQNMELEQFQNAMLAKVNPAFASQSVANAAARAKTQAEHGDPNRIAAAKLANDRYIAEVGASGAVLAAQAKEQGFDLKPNPAGGWMMFNKAGVAFEVIPETPATKNAAAVPARAVRIQMPAMNTGVPGQPAAVYDATTGTWK